MAKTGKPNNPVTRLYLILEEARKKDAGWPVRRVWAEVLNTGNDNLALHLGIAELIQLVNEAENTERRGTSFNSSIRCHVH